jgi:hypothetical protein
MQPDVMAPLSIAPEVPSWRNWQTRWTQNPEIQLFSNFVVPSTMRDLSTPA